MTSQIPTGQIPTGQIPSGPNWRLILGGFLAAAAISALCMAWVDEPTARFLRDAFDADQRRFFGHTIGALGKPEFYFAAAALTAVVCWLLRRRLTSGGEALRRAMHAALFVILSIASAGILVNLLKFAIGRTRPRELLENGVSAFIPIRRARTWPRGWPPPSPPAASWPASIMFRTW